MSESPRLSSVDRRVRTVCLLFAASSYPLAAYILVAPEAFWSALGLGGNPFVQALYGGAIGAEGVMFTLGAWQPARYRLFFEYMVVYKTLAVLGGARVLAGGATPPPLGGVLVLAGWSVAGLVSAWVVRGAARPDREPHESRARS